MGTSLGNALVESRSFLGFDFGVGCWIEIVECGRRAGALSLKVPARDLRTPAPHLLTGNWDSPRPIGARLERSCGSLTEAGYLSAARGSSWPFAVRARLAASRPSRGPAGGSWTSIFGRPEIEFSPHPAFVVGPIPAWKPMIGL